MEPLHATLDRLDANEALERETLGEAADAASQLADRFAQKRALAAHASLTADLRALARSGWHSPTLVALAEPTAVTLLVPTPSNVVDSWHDWERSPVLRIAMIAHATLVRLAREVGAASRPRGEPWGGFLALTLDAAGGLDTAELRAGDLELLLGESTPKGWSGRGRENAVQLAWLTRSVLERREGIAPGVRPQSRVTRPDAARVTIEQIAADLELDPLEVVRHCVDHRQPLPEFALDARMMGTLAGWAGVEAWWSADDDTEADPTAAPPHDDPNPRRRIVRWIPYKLVAKGKIGGSHTRVDNAWRGLAGQWRGFGKSVVELMKREGLLLSKPTVNGEHVFLDPTRLDTVRAIIDWRDPPDAFRRLAE